LYNNTKPTIIKQTMSVRSAVIRLNTSKLYSGLQTRTLSGQGNMAVRRLQQVFEEYRMANYTQEMPSRFKKEVICAAKHPNEEYIAIEGIERVIHNIGAAHKISYSEIEVIFNELGVSGNIAAERMVKLI
jgi:hypothetical protein